MQAYALNIDYFSGNEKARVALGGSLEECKGAISGIMLVLQIQGYKLTHSSVSEGVTQKARMAGNGKEFIIELTKEK